MNSKTRPNQGPWSIGKSSSSTPEYLSRHYQTYLEQRDIILSQATEVLGGRDLSEQWCNRPARGLDYRFSRSFVLEDHGYRLVRDYLERIEYGVY